MRIEAQAPCCKDSGKSTRKIEAQAPCRQDSGQSLKICVTISSSVSSISFTLNNPPICTRTNNKCHDNSNEAFNYAREVERRRAPRGEPSKDPSPKPKKVAYVVFNGRSLGIFYNWAACEASIANFPGQRFKGYYTRQAARDAWDHANAVRNIGPVAADTAAGPSTHTQFNHIISDEEAYWAVLRGRYPGVYHGLQNAKAAAGEVEGVWVIIRALTKDEACRAFTKGYMKGRVVALRRRT